MKSYIFDIMTLIGLACLTYGAWAIYEPLVFVVPGIAMVAGGILGASKWAS